VVFVSNFFGGFMIREIFLRTPFNFDTDENSDETGLKCMDKSLAVQASRDECDINVLVERFGLTGRMPDQMVGQLMAQVQIPPKYNDFGEIIFDYQTAANAVIQADKSFMSLPAKLRSRFSNSPQALLDFLSNDANRDEAVALGLVNPPAVAAVDSPAAKRVEDKPTQ
jgi:phage internal scaffolding protein